MRGPVSNASMAALSGAFRALQLALLVDLCPTSLCLDDPDSGVDRRRLNALPSPTGPENFEPVGCRQGAQSKVLLVGKVAETGATADEAVLGPTSSQQHDTRSDCVPVALRPDEANVQVIARKRLGSEDRVW